MNVGADPLFAENEYRWPETPIGDSQETSERPPAGT